MILKLLWPIPNQLDSYIAVLQNVHLADQLVDALLPHYRDAYPELA
jgi:hypothetical protein